MKKLITIAFCLSILTSFGQVKDIDGTTYKTVKIGSQTWMAENLNVSHYRNGAPIPQVQDSASWNQLTTGAWCYYENKTENGAKYGKLYNWYAVNDARGLAPMGWHIPAESEFNLLTAALGGDIAGKKIKSATEDWGSYRGTNQSGFSGLPGGGRVDNFGLIGMYGGWWTSTQKNATTAQLRYVVIMRDKLSIHQLSKKSGYSVRCVKN